MCIRDSNDGASIDEVGAALENVNTDSATVVIGKNDTSYPDGFFDSGSAIEPGKTGAFIAGDYVYIVSREAVSYTHLILTVLVFHRKRFQE